MNIACTACSARYGVADDKLIGKRVRITCKRCGTVLIVDGNTNPPTVSASSSIAPARPSSSHPPLEVRSPPPVAEPPFTVLFADSRQEQADIAQIVRFHRSGQLGSDSLVWREGMAEWTNPWDVTEIAAAFRRMGYARPTPVPAAPAAAQEPVADAYDDEATQVVESSPQHEPPRYEDGEPPTNVVNPSRLSRPPATEPRAASTAAAEDDDDPTYVARAAGSTNATAAAREAQRARRASTQPPRTAGHWNEPGQPATREPAARAKKVSAPPPAARTSSRPPAQARARSTRPAAPREDLFARQSRAGSEEEQEAEAAPEYGLDGPRLTGARNETSVLFSLDSLIKKEPPPAVRRTPPPRDESLLVDSGNSLPVGGGFAPALSAPDFTAPVSAPPPPAPSLPSAPYGHDTDAARSSRAWLYVLVLVAVGGVGVVGWRTGVLPSLLVKAGGGTPQPAVVAAPAAPPTVPSASAHAASPEAAASSSAGAETSSSAAAATSAAPTATASATATKPTPAAPTATTRATAVATRATAAHESSARESALKDTASEESAPKETASKEAPAATAAAASNAGPFDTAAAKEALTATAGNAGNCKQADGPTGNGKVSITFAPSGRPTSVAVTGDLAGTTVGSCVARMFRGVKVPPFSGDPVTVAKSFSIE